MSRPNSVENSHALLSPKPPPTGKRTVEDREEVASVDTLFDDLLGTAQLEADIRNRGLLETGSTDATSANFETTCVMNYRLT